jgi:tRNA(Met) cytidine acetyltransferase
VNELLLLGAEPASVQGISAAAVDQPQFEWLDRPDLLQSPKRLSQVVGLLVNAHYRTSPDDLRILLDAPNIRILVAASADAVAAVAMVAAEGDLPTELAAAIRQGQRRPRGHLLPQTLWAHTGNARLLSESCWRVVRIAVHPALQRRGLGQRMLERIQQSAVEHGINYLGSSFACSSGLVSFWQQAGYLPVAMGVRRDASSGSHSLLVLRGLAKDTQATVEQERTRFADRFGAALSASLQQLEPEIVGALLPVLSPSHAALQARDSIDLRDFVSGARRYEHCQFALRKVALALLSAPLSTSGLSELQRRVLIAGVLQQQPAGVLAQRYPLRGKAAVLECLRTAFASYQAAAAGQPVNRSGA